MSHQTLESLCEPLNDEEKKRLSAQGIEPVDTEYTHETLTSASGKHRRRVALSRVSISHDDPIELQIETMSPIVGRIMFYFWYALLALAIIIQSIITLQWQSTNMCNGEEVSLTHIGSWTSPCSARFDYSVVSNNMTTNYTDIAWEGVMDTNPLVRFLHIVFSMANPNMSITETYTIDFGYTITNTSVPLAKVPNATARLDVYCEAQQTRCSTVVLATEATGKPNASHVSLIAIGVNPLIAAAIASNSSVGTVQQKRAYTIASIVVRYVLMGLSLLHLARFLYHKKFTSTLYEQTWISILHGGLFLYLDPLFAAGVYITPEPNVLAFLEFRVPTYFMALLVAFMFSLITSSMSWTHTTSLYNPPWWTKIACLVFLMIIFTLDIVDSSKDNWNWNLEHCPNFSCDTLGYILYGFLILGVLICTGWLYWLRDNLGTKSYLESRPQQLAVRVFIFMFTTTVLYFVVQSLTIFFAFRDISGIVTYQALIQIPPILVSVFFVNIMTFVYTTQSRSERVPIRPSDQRWKKAVWPESWYQWLGRHGGSMYIFYNEQEESQFYDIQARFASRRARSIMEERGDEHLGIDHANEMLLEEEHIGSPIGSKSVMKFDDTNQDEDDDDGDDDDRDNDASSDVDNVTSEDDTVDNDDETSPEGAGERSREPTITSPLSPSREGGGESTRGTRTSVFDLTWLFEDSKGSGNNRGGGKKKKRNGAKPKHRIASKIPGGVFVIDAVNNVTRSVSRLVQRAEHEIIDRTATFIDAVENRFLDTFHTKLRHKPFFNLETAVCCFNLSWEAYSVSVSQGDQMISTGVNVHLPEVKPAAEKTVKVITSCFTCCGGDDDEDDGGVRRHSSSQGPLSSPIREYGSVSLPGQTSPSMVSMATITQPTIDVEKYGYIQIAVAEREAVQVVISKLDTDCPAHRGKYPRIVIAFRGTENIKNAKADLNIRRVAWDEVDSTLWQSASRSRPSVHVGFLGIWGALREFVMTTVLEQIGLAPEIPYRVVCTGHSMGGAVAVLCAFTMHKTLMHLGHLAPDPIVYSFGQPRVGNKSFQKAYNKAIPNTFRVVNESDAVSFVTMFGGCHVGMEVDIDRNGNFICEPMFMERTLRPMKGKGSAIGNHLMSSYAESLNAIASKVATCKLRCLVPCSAERASSKFRSGSCEVPAPVQAQCE